MCDYQRSGVSLESEDMASPANDQGSLLLKRQLMGEKWPGEGWELGVSNLERV